MPAERLAGFSGVIPKIAPRLLAPMQAQIAANCKLWSGEIIPIKDTVSEYASGKTGPLQSAIRLTDDTTGVDVWLAWNEVVDAVRGPIASDTSQRTYFTGEGEPRVTNLTLAISGGLDNYPAIAYVLGIPAPATEPTVTPSGGSGSDTTRSYVYTFVSKTTLPNGNVLDEEGPPSPITTADGKVDDTWAVSDMETAPPNTGSVVDVEVDQPDTGYVRIQLDSIAYLRIGERITFASVGGVTDLNATFEIVGIDDGSSKVWVELATAQSYTSGGTWTRQAKHNTSGMVKRIYRTDDAGLYRLVVEVPIATTSYNDTLLDEDLAGKSLMVSTSYYQPPANMHSLILLPNGSMCGISGNELCASVPYQPHAWPPEWRKTASYDGVSLGHVGTMVVMTTEGQHYVAQGVDPSNWTLDESKGRPFPCVSKRGTVSMDQGVVWPTHDGLAIQTPSGSALFTEGVFEHDDWQAFGPNMQFAALHSGRYVAAFTRPGSDVQEMMILDPSEQAFMVLASVQAHGFYADIRNGDLYVLHGTSILRWDSDLAGRLSADWMSKEFVFPQPLNMGAAKVDAEFTLTPEEQVALEAVESAGVAGNEALIASGGWMGGEVGGYAVGMHEVGASFLLPVQEPTYDQLFFYLYANGVLKFGRRVRDTRGFKLPGGYKADAYAVRVISNVKVKAIVFGTSMKALAQA